MIRFSNCNLPPYPEKDIKAAEETKWAALSGKCVTRKITKEEILYYEHSTLPTRHALSERISRLWLAQIPNVIEIMGERKTSVRSG